MAKHDEDESTMPELDFALAPYAAAAPEAAAASAPSRRLWRFNPPFSGEWLDQVKLHLAAMDWPEVDLLGGRTVGGSAEAWAEHFDGLQALEWGIKPRWGSLAERQELERRVRYAEACYYAMLDGEPKPADPDAPETGKMWASPERMNLE